MATFTQWSTKVLKKLGDPNAGRWDASDIQDLMEDKQADLINEVPLDALKSLEATNTVAKSSASAFIDFGSTVFSLITFQAEESDGQYGAVYDVVSLEILRDIKALDPTLSFDTAPFRIMTDPHKNESAEFFPAIPQGRNYTYHYIAFPSTPSNSVADAMTLPNADPNLQRLLFYAVVAETADDKSFDVQMAERYQRKYDIGLEKIRNLYFNKFGLSPIVKDNLLNSFIKPAYHYRNA